MFTLPSSNGHRETLGRLHAALERRGLTVFAQIDHAAAARGAGLDLADEVVVIFGNPAAGTALMKADQRVGIELPLRMLVWDRGSETIVGYNDPRELAASYNVKACGATLEAMASLLDQMAQEATAAADLG